MGCRRHLESGTDGAALTPAWTLLRHARPCRVRPSAPRTGSSRPGSPAPVSPASRSPYPDVCATARSTASGSTPTPRTKHPLRLRHRFGLRASPQHRRPGRRLHQAHGCRLCPQRLHRGGHLFSRLDPVPSGARLHRRHLHALQPHVCGGHVDAVEVRQRPHTRDPHARGHRPHHDGQPALPRLHRRRPVGRRRGVPDGGIVEADTLAPAAPASSSHPARWTTAACSSSTPSGPSPRTTSASPATGYTVARLQECTPHRLSCRCRRPHGTR